VAADLQAVEALAFAAQARQELVPARPPTARRVAEQLAPEPLAPEQLAPGRPPEATKITALRGVPRVAGRSRQAPRLAAK